MTAIITEKFRQSNATIFKNEFGGSNKYFLFIGKAMPWLVANDGGGTSDSVPPVPADDVGSEFYYWDDMIAAKSIGATDATYTIPRRDWAATSTFDMYEHDISSGNATTSGATNLYNSTFYFMTSSYKVYKVLYSSGSAIGGNEPTSTEVAPFWHESTGYMLQYMYTMSTSEVNKFLTSDFMPVSVDATLQAGAVDGSIDTLIVTAGSGYSPSSGTYYAPIYGDGTGGVAKIVVDGGSVSAFSSAGSAIQAAGTGYTYGTVNLTTRVYTTSGAAATDDGASNLANTTGIIGTTSGSAASINVQISPKGGHAYDAIKELGGHFIMINVTLTAAEGDDIATGNDFRRVGLIKNPYTYGTTSGTTYSAATTARQTRAVHLASFTGTGFVIDEEITQVGGAVGRVIEWDASNKLLYYQQERFQRYGTTHTGKIGKETAFTGSTTIVGAASNGTPDTSSNSPITLANGNAVTPVNGYVNPELQPDYGEIIYVENRKPISRSTDQTEDIKIIVEF